MRPHWLTKLKIKVKVVIIRILLLINFIIIASLSFAGGELCNKWYNGKLAGYQFWGNKASDAEVIECVEKVGINFQSLYGDTPFNHASSYAHVSVARLALLRSLGADINLPDNYGNTPLVRAAAYSSNPEVIFYLLAEGADISSQETRNDALNALVRNHFGLWKNESLRVALGGPNNVELSESDVGRFAYPVNGKIIREYVKNKTDGIDISAPEGSPVVAAETGFVAAITVDTQGVPIIVLKHEGTLLTVYAGLGNITVKEEDEVYRGQIIGTVGSGNPSFLHFEVREGFKSLDPMAFLNPNKNKRQIKNERQASEVITSLDAAEVVTIDPDLKKFKFGTLDSIPNAPEPILEKDIRGGCNWYILDKEEQKISLSNDIRKKGWAILSEAQLGLYDLIAFAGKFEVETSATCYVKESNIAIFNNGSLFGVIYLQTQEDTKIGHFEKMDDGFLRLYSGDPLQVPVVDLNIHTNGLKLDPISKKPLRYCGKKTVIPNTLGMTIQDARDKLWISGFNRIEHQQEPESYTSKTYPGINELAGCSNGIPWCYFEYEDKYSKVTLRTLGSAEVVRSDVVCK